jgi:hypothetical protein
MGRCRAPSKKVGQRIHARRRARQRYGATLARRDLDAIVELIRGGQSEPVNIRSTSLRVSGHRVTYAGRTWIVVYDRSRHSIATFLTEDMIADSEKD